MSLISINFLIKFIRVYEYMYLSKPGRVGLVVSVSASHTVGREFASWPCHTKDHHKNGTNCLSGVDM